MSSGEREGSAVPSDLALRYIWQAGSMPPPYHDEYEIRIGPGPAGEVVYVPDYPQHNPPTWREPFPVTAEALARLYALLEEAGLFQRAWRRRERGATGGELAWLEVTAGGRTVKVPAQLAARDAEALAPVYAAVRALVPAALWQALEARREADASGIEGPDAEAAESAE